MCDKMPRENECLLCGVRSSRCILFPARSTPRRQGWLRALNLCDDELRPRGGNYVCRDHFCKEDFDQDGILSPHAIPQPMSPLSTDRLFLEEGEFPVQETVAKVEPTSGWVSPALRDEASSSSHAEPFFASGVSAMGSRAGEEKASFIKQEGLPVQTVIKQEITEEEPLGAAGATFQDHTNVTLTNHAGLVESRSCTSTSGSPVGRVGGGHDDRDCKPPLLNKADAVVSSSSSEQDCPVCLQPYSHPVKLPCGHIFCFLCAKGFTSQHGRCAFCRALIPAGYMDLPVLVPDEHRSNANVDSKFTWYYEGRNGWWQFEERHSDELEEALQKGEMEHELQISGFIYMVDLQRMVQYRRDRPVRTRRIKRDHFTAPRKGIAGLRDDLISGTVV